MHELERDSGIRGLSKAQADALVALTTAPSAAFRASAALWASATALWNVRAGFNELFASVTLAVGWMGRLGLVPGWLASTSVAPSKISQELFRESRWKRTYTLDCHLYPGEDKTWGPVEDITGCDHTDWKESEKLLAFIPNALQNCGISCLLPSLWTNPIIALDLPDEYTTHDGAHIDACESMQEILALTCKHKCRQHWCVLAIVEHSCNHGVAGVVVVAMQGWNMARLVLCS